MEDASRGIGLLCALVRGLADFPSPAAQRLAQPVGLGRGPFRSRGQVVRLLEQRLADLARPVGRLFRNALQVLGMTAQHLGDRLRPKVGVFRGLGQFRRPLADHVVGGVGPRRRLLRGPGQLGRLPAQGVGDFGNPALRTVGGIGQTLQVPAQGFRLAAQLAPALVEGDHHPQQGDRRDDTRRQPSQLVGQQGQQVGKRKLFVDDEGGKEQPGDAQDRPGHHVEAITQVERRGPFVGGIHELRRNHAVVAGRRSGECLLVDVLGRRCRRLDGRLP